MSFYDSPQFRPEVRKRLDPYRAQMEAAAARHGVPPDLMFGTVAAESSGVANAVGDNGVARGLWQVQTPYLKDWMGAGPDVRNSPAEATERIMPAFSKNLEASGGDWGLATVRYMRGAGAAEFKRIKAGEPAAQVLAHLPHVLARYNSMRAVQGKRGLLPPPIPKPGQQALAREQAQAQPDPNMVAAQAGAAAGATAAMKFAEYQPVLGVAAPPRMPRSGRGPGELTPEQAMRMFGIDLGVNLLG